MEREAGCEVAVNTHKDVADAQETIFFQTAGTQPGRGSSGRRTPAAAAAVFVDVAVCKSFVAMT